MHRIVETNGIRMHIAEHGAGPLVLLCHGWPESWYSWRHQLRALGEAGYHAVAPDQRGYGPTDPPEAVFYQLYFQKPGVAEAELEHDVRASIRRLLYSISGDAPLGARLGLVPRRGGLLSAAVDPDPLPGWLTEADVDVYTREFERTGFRGGLNWYRNIDRNWELLAPFSGARVTVPALFIAGDRDPVLSFPGSQAALDGIATPVPNLRKTLILEGCGHWTQQERPAEVNTAMLEFLRSL